ncbi:MAG: polysaccharide deacetylase family protein [Bacteroidales bacterium]|nr:polysaccharide deacetylase family protein [Bacteroidales bacterium]
MTGFFRFPGPARLLYREAIFRMPGNRGKVYLTFDDGPTPGSTETIIEILKENGVGTAVFFCNGSNILKYPEQALMISDNAYSVANHGYLHLDGWKSNQSSYISNCIKGSELSGSVFYRPPYGHLSIPQYIRLKKSMKIVFWDLLLHDYNTGLGVDYIMSKTSRLIRPGSVIVLHDKGNKTTPEVLKKLIVLCRSRGYDFGDITSDA